MQGPAKTYYWGGLMVTTFPDGSASITIRPLFGEGETRSYGLESAEVDQLAKALTERKVTR